MNIENNTQCQIALSLLPRLNAIFSLPLMDRCGGIRAFFEESEQALAAIYQELEIHTPLPDRAKALEEAKRELEKCPARTLLYRKPPDGTGRQIACHRRHTACIFPLPGTGGQGYRRTMPKRAPPCHRQRAGIRDRRCRPPFQPEARLAHHSRRGAWVTPYLSCRPQAAGKRHCPVRRSPYQRISLHGGDTPQQLLEAQPDCRGHVPGDACRGVRHKRRSHVNRPHRPFLQPRGHGFPGATGRCLFRRVQPIDKRKCRRFSRKWA